MALVEVTQVSNSVLMVPVKVTRVFLRAFTMLVTDYHIATLNRSNSINN